LTENVVNKEVFLKNVKLVVSESLYEEVSIMVKAEEITSINSRRLDRSYDISKMIQEKRIKINEIYKNSFLKKDLHEPLKEVNKNLEIDPDEIIDEGYNELNLGIGNTVII
jgi:hypothetical protein